MKITIDEFCNQWLKGDRHLISQFQQNVFDFTTVTGNYSKRFFRTSFLAGGFYGSGQAWKPRESRWGKKFTHPVMKDTEMLASNIKGDEFARENNRTGWRDNGKRLFKRGARFDVQSEEVGYASKGRRGRNTNAKGYAAIHNTDPSLSGYTVNQYSSRRPVWRQFIGFSPKLDSDVNEHLTKILFRNMPRQ